MLNTMAYHGSHICMGILMKDTFYTNMRQRNSLNYRFDETFIEYEYS
jgi:hypothetical protein